MKKYHITVSIVGSHYAGCIEAKSKADAIKKAERAFEGVSLCCECSREISDPEPDMSTMEANEADDDEEVTL